jgi:hypothetical protein
MRRIHRVFLLAAVLGMAPAIAGCSNFDLDSLDVLGVNQKKKLPGERRPLFPEGVPGVSQGIPPEYLKGNAQEQAGAAMPAAPLKPVEAAPENKTATAEPVEEKPKAEPKPKARHVAARPKPTRVKIEKPEEKAKAEPAAAEQQAAPWPAPAQPKPATQTASPWPAPTQQAPAPWPSAPPPGTFSKQ